MQEDKILFLGDFLIDVDSRAVIDYLAEISDNYAAIFQNLECSLRPGESQPIRSPYWGEILSISNTNGSST